MIPSKGEPDVPLTLWVIRFLESRNWRVYYDQGSGRIFAEHNFRACKCIYMEIYRRAGKDQYLVAYRYGVMVIEP